jgi:hypothetical protein
MTPVRFALPHTTAAALALAYTPFHWPALGRFRFQGGFSIEEPWDGYRGKRWYADARRPFDLLQALLAPHSDEWIEALCIAAFVPDVTERKFSVHVNGTMLCAELPESAGLRRRMLLQKRPILTTVSDAKIVGGGRMRNGDKRGYGVFIDIEPFSR